MLVIYPAKKSAEETVKEENALPPVKPEDWAYMKMSGEVLKNLPDTWKVYPDTDEGRRAIIDMEYHELKQALAINAPKEDVMRELVHLGSATLHYWRLLNAAQ